MGNSPIATRVAPELGSVKLDSIIKDGALGQLRMELDATAMSVKVALLDYASTEGPQSNLPNELRQMLDDCRSMIHQYYLEHKHTGPSCDLIIFQTLTTPAEYVCMEDPHTISAVADQTLWHNQINEMLSRTSRQYTCSYAFSMNSKIRGGKSKGKHCWANWVEYNSADPLSKAICRTPTQLAFGNIVSACCKHICVFQPAARKS